MISIYTHTNNPLKKEFWKYIAKKAVRKYSGPDAVLDSLKRGLKELDIPFQINPLIRKYNTVHVLAGISILEEMINKKTQGKIKTLIAGPALVQTPYDHNDIIQDKNIDLILFPSQWTKDFYVNLVPNLEEKIKIWPAGVKIPEKVSNKKKVLIFKKNIPEDVYNQIIKILQGKDISYDIITYGNYNKDYYHQCLLNASVLIYLQPTESQGLALQEAWSYDVPTMVWQNKIWKGEKYEWFDDKISAPYLTKDSGVFFSLDTFESELENIINNQHEFNPRKYCIENLSDKATAKIYLEKIKPYVK
jgi:hypothetical protein